jgi:hypothetical protein
MSFENDFVKFDFDRITLYAIIVVKKPNPTNDDEFEEVLTFFTNFYKACDQIDQKFILYYDLTELGLLKYEQYNKFTSLFKQHVDITVKCLICSSIICSNQVIAGVINGLLKLYENQKPIKIVTSKEDALLFINENHSE